MGDLLIRDMPDELKRELNEIAQGTGRSLSEEAKGMLRRGIAAYRAEESTESGKSGYDVLRELFAPLPGDDGEFSKIMDEVEAQRRKDFGRPFSFDE